MNPVRQTSRRGFSWFALLAVIGIPAGMALIGYLSFFRRSSSSEKSDVLLAAVTRGVFAHEVTERGEVESASNIELRCEVQSRNTAGTAILEIVPEGTYVQPGQILVKLDSSTLENERTQQQIVCNTSEATMIQATNVLETAKIARQEYLNGTYKELEQAIESERFVALETLRRAQEYVVFSQRLAAKGYITPLQLEADRFAVKKAEMDLQTANTKFDVLRNYTKVKMLNQLDSDIKTAEAKLKAEQSSHQLDMDKLKTIDDQLAKCIIRAPEPGQVVYANESDHHGSGEILIEEGSSVRERQAIIRLPDPKRMQVKAKVSEARVALISPGMTATVLLDAFPDSKLTGTVEKVDDFPLAAGWFNSNVKEYATIIQVQEPFEGLRPGLTAQVKIRIEQMPNVLQVPVQAILEHGGKHYCILPDQMSWETREVSIGSTNDKFVVIQNGLKEGERVLLNAYAYRDEIDLPELPAGQQELLAQGRPRGRKSAGRSPEPGSALAAKGSAKGVAKGPRSAGPEGKARPASEVARTVESLFQQHDKNADGVLSRDEFSNSLQSQYPGSDANGDGLVDRRELMVAVARVKSAQPAGPTVPAAANAAPAPGRASGARS
ncbi:MAG: HlyD family efflux transporter periplasmic adaptor subunit [Pirellulales bacterium]